MGMTIAQFEALDKSATADSVKFFLTADDADGRG
jgi:hypothetical protein